MAWWLLIKLVFQAHMDVTSGQICLKRCSLETCSLIFRCSWVCTWGFSYGWCTWSGQGWARLNMCYKFLAHLKLYWVFSELVKILWRLGDLLETRIGCVVKIWPHALLVLDGELIKGRQRWSCITNNRLLLQRLRPRLCVLDWGHGIGFYDSFKGMG